MRLREHHKVPMVSKLVRVFIYLFVCLFVCFNLVFIVDTITDVPISPTLPTSTQSPAPLPSGHYHTVVCVHGLHIYVLRLIPPCSLIQSLLPPAPDICQSVSW